MENTVETSLYDLLVTRDFDPEILDASGKEVSNPSQAEMFSFDWKTENKNYGTVVILLGNDSELEVYYGDNLGRTMEGEDRTQWYDFLQQLKQFATRNLLTFELNNINRLKYTMKGMAAIREGLFEGYYGTRKMSYSDQPKKVKLVIKHNKTLGEGDARFRYIESLFVETADGERFKVPTRNLAHGKMLARHVAEGGNPYDAFGQHIGEIVNEMSVLSKFVRAAKHRQFNDEAQHMVETAVLHYRELKDKAKRMVSQRGYREERDNFRPDEFRDSEIAVEAIKDMFVQQSLDQRIEEALPILAKLKNESKTEADAFESWANRISEGTWSLPDSDEKQTRLRELLKDELPVGPDATNATEQLYDIFGDDELFDRLGDLATQNPEADARPVILARMKELGIDQSLEESLNNNLVGAAMPMTIGGKAKQHISTFKPVRIKGTPKEGPVHNIMHPLRTELLPGADNLRLENDEYSDTLYYRDPKTNGIFSFYYHGLSPRIRSTKGIDEERMREIVGLITNNGDMSENLDSDGIMMTRPSNMSSESREPSSALNRLIELVRV